MSDVLVDTDVFSYLLKRDSCAARYAAHLEGSRLFLAFMTVGECYRWAVARNLGSRTDRAVAR